MDVSFFWNFEKKNTHPSATTKNVTTKKEKIELFIFTIKRLNLTKWNRLQMMISLRKSLNVLYDNWWQFIWTYCSVINNEHFYWNETTYEIKNVH